MYDSNSFKKIPIEVIPRLVLHSVSRSSSPLDCSDSDELFEFPSVYILIKNDSIC